MQVSQGHLLLSLRAVQDFLDTNAAALAGVVGTSTRRKLDDAVTELSAHASDQSGNTLSAQGSTKKHRAIRTVLLRDYMAPIARIARIELPITPEIEPLRMPKARANVEQLVAAAHGMATAAAAHGATKSLQTKLAAARRVVHALDALVRTSVKDNPTLLANWNQVKRVPKVRGRSASAASTSSIAAATTPAEVVAVS